MKKLMEKSKLIISLDFELHWGVFDAFGDKYNKNILGARQAIPEILVLFEKYNINATWAIVGMLFNESKEDFQFYSPKLKPSYTNKELNPYRSKIGISEDDDPLHYAHTLIKLIKESSGQEVGCHTYSHYYCLAKGQNIDQFDADIKSAVKIAKEKFDINLKSFVFPKNEVNPEYLKVLKNNQIQIFRDSWSPFFKNVSVERVFRLINSYLKISKNRFNKVKLNNGLKAINGDRFLRPFTNSIMNILMIKRIKNEMESAAKINTNYHLWWHPHNFGSNLDKNLSNLEEVLKHYNYLNKKYGMTSASMNQL